MIVTIMNMDMKETIRDSSLLPIKHCKTLLIYRKKINETTRPRTMINSENNSWIKPFIYPLTLKIKKIVRTKTSNTFIYFFNALPILSRFVKDFLIILIFFKMLQTICYEYRMKV